MDIVTEGRRVKHDVKKKVFANARKTLETLSRFEQMPELELPVGPSNATEKKRLRDARWRRRKRLSLLRNFKCKCPGCGGVKFTSRQWVHLSHTQLVELKMNGSKLAAVARKYTTICLSCARKLKNGELE
jgi:hypothetical protein